MGGEDVVRVEDEKVKRWDGETVRWCETVKEGANASVGRLGQLGQSGVVSRAVSRACAYEYEYACVVQCMQPPSPSVCRLPLAYHDHTRRDEPLKNRTLRSCTKALESSGTDPGVATMPLSRSFESKLVTHTPTRSPCTACSAAL